MIWPFHIRKPFIPKVVLLQHFIVIPIQGAKQRKEVICDGYSYLGSETTFIVLQLFSGRKRSEGVLSEGYPQVGSDQRSPIRRLYEFVLVCADQALYQNLSCNSIFPTNMAEKNCETFTKA